MFKGASMIIVPPAEGGAPLVEMAKELLAPAGFGRFTITTAEHHDEMIAFTSQMCHVVSNAYVKSPRAQEHAGYSREATQTSRASRSSTVYVDGTLHRQQSLPYK